MYTLKTHICKYMYIYMIRYSSIDMAIAMRTAGNFIAIKSSRSACRRRVAATSPAGARAVVAAEPWTHVAEDYRQS